MIFLSRLNEITITIPLPDRVLSPNGRAHWGRIARAKKHARELAYYLALQAGSAGERWEAADLVATFWHRTKRTRDRDNALASLKAHIDGIVAAGLLKNDSGVFPQPVEFVVKKCCEERVELRFTRRDLA